MIRCVVLYPVPTAAPTFSARCSSSISRDEFERLAAGLLAGVERTLKDALRKACLRAEDIDTVERVGGASRTPAIAKAITNVFGLAAVQELKRYDSTPNQALLLSGDCSFQAEAAGGGCVPMNVCAWQRVLDPHVCS